MKHNFSQSSLSIGAWNVDSLHTRIANIRTSKLDLDPVKDILGRLDIFCLS